jgi:hypothetical protein
MKRPSRIRQAPIPTLTRQPSNVTGGDELREGIVAALRSQQTPPFPVIVSRLFGRAGIGQRVRLLKCLLQSVGPLAVTVVGAGVFVECAARAGWRGVLVTTEDAVRVTGAQVFELARYVEQANPRILEQITDILARDPNGLAILGTSVAAVAVSVVRQRRRRTASLAP